MKIPMIRVWYNVSGFVVMLAGHEPAMCSENSKYSYQAKTILSSATS